MQHSTFDLTYVLLFFQFPFSVHQSVYVTGFVQYQSDYINRRPPLYPLYYIYRKTNGAIMTWIQNSNRNTADVRFCYYRCWITKDYYRPISLSVSTTEFCAACPVESDRRPSAQRGVCVPASVVVSETADTTLRGEPLGRVQLRLDYRNSER